MDRSEFEHGIRTALDPYLNRIKALELYIDKLHKELERFSFSAADEFDPSPNLPFGYKSVATKFEIDNNYQLVNYSIKYYDKNVYLSICHRNSDLYLMNRDALIELSCKKLAEEVIKQLNEGETDNEYY